MPFNNHIALQDTVLPQGGGPDGLAPIVVSAGMEISLPHYPLYCCRNIFGENADEFLPERWFPPAVDKTSQAWTRQLESYLPFSIGKWVCPGQQIALETIRYATIQLLQEFSDIHNVSGGQPWQENCRATLQSKHGVVVTMSRTPNWALVEVKGDNDVASGNQEKGEISQPT